MQPNMQQKSDRHKPPIAELNTPEKRANPFPIFQQLRETTPVRYDESRQTRDFFLHEDCVRILKDPVAFSSNFNRLGFNDGKSIITTDPPRHTDFRDKVNQVFTPKAIQDMEPHIRDIANELLDLVIERGAMNTIRDFSAPLPVIVIAEMLGVPSSDRLKFKEWSDKIVEGLNDDSEEAYQKLYAEQLQARKELKSYFQSILEQRKSEPKNDLITILWQANEQNPVLSEDEVLGFYTTLLVAGNETTTNLIANGVRILIEHPALQEQLRENPALIPSFVEEVLRVYPPSVRSARRAVQDAEIRGHKIKAGDIANTWTISANRDPAKMSDPETFVVDRQPNPHISFGFGIHFCLGAPLARLEGKVVFETLVQRLFNIKKADGEPYVFQPYPMFTAMKELPIVFDAGSRQK